MLRVHKSMLVHEAEYLAYKGKNDNGDYEYAEPTKIKHVRIDEKTVTSRDKLQVRIIANAVIFMYADHSKPFMRPKEQSKIKVGDKEWVVQTISTISHPTKSKPWAYEIEVL